MLYRKIKPENGYCLYFPNREEEKRFEAGRRVIVWLWEDWKHIKLGQFKVTYERLRVPTADNLDCEVTADFAIVVGGPEKGRESRLAKATISCPPTRDIKDKIELTFFRDWATNYCESSIVRAIQKCSYVNLVEDVGYRTETVNRIENDARETLDYIGLILVRCTVVIEPLEPKSILATKDILDKWLEFRRTLDAANLAKLKANHERIELEAESEKGHSKRLKEIHDQGEIEKKEIENITKIKIAETNANTAIVEKKQERDRDEIIVKIQEEMDVSAQQTQLQRIRRTAQIKEEELKLSADLEEERERNKQILENLMRQDEEQRQQHELAIQQLELQKLEKEKEAKRKEVELVELKEIISMAEAEQERRMGTIKAQIMRDEALARSADVIAMRELFMTALPKVMEMANRPIEKMGEIKMHLYGGSDIGSGQNNNTIGAVLASASTLPIIKECLRFLKEWESDTTEGMR